MNSAPRGRHYYLKLPEAQIHADNLELVFLPLLYHPAIYSLPPHSHPIPTVSRKSSMSTTVTRVYCVPKFYPSHGHADTYQHDRSIDGRYYVVSVGRSIGVYTSPYVVLPLFFFFFAF